MFFMLTWMMSLVAGNDSDWCQMFSTSMVNGWESKPYETIDGPWSILCPISLLPLHTLMSRNIGACKHRENKTKVFSLCARILKTMMLVLQLALSKWPCLLLTCCVVPIYRKVVHLWSKEFYLVRELDCFSAKVLGTEVTDAPLPSLIFLQCTPSLSKVNRQ